MSYVYIYICIHSHGASITCEILLRETSSASAATSGAGSDGFLGLNHVQFTCTDSSSRKLTSVED